MKWLTRRDGMPGFAPATVLNNQVNRLFRDFFQDWGLDTAVATEGWAPPMDVEENADEFVVTTELPGVDRNDVQITAIDNELSIRGEVRSEEETNERAWHARERRRGTFFRTLRLPVNVDTDKVKASFANGVLRLQLPKREEAKPRQIPIDGAK
jgi:HSP20 family protein